MKNIYALMLFLVVGGFCAQAQEINLQDGTFFLCTGTLYDSGGPTGPYSNDENIVMTLCSDTPGIGIELDFTFFNTNAPADVLTIYDGPDTASPVIGDYSGTTGPGFVAATGASGCLTLEFNSDFVINTAGWAASISCCQVINASFDSSTPPAAPDGTITAAVAENITFNGSATFSLDGTGAVYEWDFGDGTTAFGTTVNHAYAAAGAYPVNLTVTDVAGCSSSTDIDVTALIGFGGADPGSLFVDAGPDVTIDCASGGSTILVADFQEIFETFSTSYTVSPIVYSPPFPFDGLANSIDLTTDDTWSAVDTLPFDFCFFGNLEQEFQVGSNGVIRFEVDGADGSNGWAFTEDLPNNSNPTLGEANIFTPVHDIFPGVNPANQIGYEILGTFPNRALVVSFYEVAMFSCTTINATHMAVLYEFSNIIDIYIQDKPVCTTWNSGNAAVGIQNNAGDLAYVPPGRNTSDSPWTTTDEAWRFAPDGAPSYVFEWLDDTGTVVGLAPTLTVSPAVTTTYTARVTYTNTCNGDVVVLEDEVVVTVDVPFTVDVGPDVSSCDGMPVLIDATVTTPPGVTYQWFQDGVLLPLETGPTYTALVSGNYRVIVSDGSCDVGDEITVGIGLTPTPGIPDPLEICDGDPADGFAEFMLTDADAQIIAGVPGLVVRYYETLALADIGDPLNQLVSPYTNITNPQTVYARLEESASGCYATVELLLNVLDSPTIIDPIPDYELCDDASGDMIEIFDLTLWDAQVSPTPGAVTITYHETAADATAGTLPITPATAYSNTSNPQTIFVRVEDASGCFATGSFNLVVVPRPTIVDPTPYELCDDALIDGFTEFDLSTKDLEITAGDADLTVTYYLTLADADAGAPVLPTLYTNVTNPQTIFVRVDSATSGCYATTTLELIVIAPPVATTPTPLTFCDPDNDGFGEFTLTDADLEISGGVAGLVVSYHETLADAEAGIGALISPYVNIVAITQTVYGRLTDPATGCFSIVELNLIVLESPVLNDPIPNYELCDDPSDDGIELFDLTTWDGQVTPLPTGLTITYHETAADAAGGTLPITPATAYSNTSNPQTIFVRLENADGCTSLGEFDLVVLPQPRFFDPTPYLLCDDGVSDGFTEFDLTAKISEITGGAGDVSVTFHLTLGDADTGAAPLPTLYTNVTNPQTIFVRVESITTGCYATTTLDLEVLDAPSATTPTPLEYCDPDNDGFGVFTLTDADLEITGGVAGVVVSYHETLADAEFGVLALTSPYNNIVFGTQTVYARVENAGVPGDCFVIVELQLLVLDTPQIVDPEPLLACDDNDDGIVVFDLTLKDSEILNGLDPTLYSVEYYEDLGFTSLITPATAYTNLTNPQTVYVLVTDVGNLCTATTSLELIVNFPPRIFPPAPLALCDVNNPGDEVEEFDLELATPEITGGDTSLIVTYHETAGDSDAGINPLSSPYTNTVNPQTIYVRVEDPDTGCFSSDVVTLDLRVNPQPSPTVNPTPLEVCDQDNDGFVDSFVLTDRDIEIINGELDITISYHETLLDAELNLFALSSPYANIVAYNQIVYARAENRITGCFTIVELELIVVNSPVLPLEIDDLVVCDTDDDGIAVFDLTLQEPQIYGSQDPATLDLSYHLTQADADAGLMPIGTPETYTNTSNPQTIWVRLADPITGCVSVGSFELIVSLPPVIAMPGDLPAYERCDDTVADGFAEFDLTLADSDITLGAVGLLVQYYTSDTDAQDDTNVIDPATSFTNTVNPQTIWVRVTDGDTGCVSFTSITIRVLPNPSPNTNPDPIEVCDSVTVGDGSEVIDLTQREASIIGGEPGVSASYYESLELAQAGDPLAAIADPTAYSNTSTPQTIYVRITNDTTGCYTIVELPIVVHPLPDAPEVSDYIICELGTDGSAVFDLTTKIPEILGGQDPALFDVTFHQVEADADAGINAIASPDSFPNSSNPEVIYVRITNPLTGCYTATQSFNIEVREGATATAPVAVYRICDNLGDGSDGIAEFSLSTQDSEILAGQDPVIYVVSYHLSDLEATDGVSPLGDSYVNITNPQTVWARVTNSDTGCFAITSLVLEVTQLPVVVLDSSYRLCVDENGLAIQNESGESSPPVIDTGLSGLDYSFEWFLAGALLADTTPSIVATQGGVYTVIVTALGDGLGCSAEGSTTVTVSSPPTSFSARVTTPAFASMHTIEAEASGLGSYVFQLDDGPFQESGTFNQVQPGEHIVTITDVNGCGSVSIVVGAIDYPLYFTPNQDGYHDTWNIIGIGANPTAKIYIFDRFGKLLKQLSPTGPGWDGTYNGNPMPSSDYWFQVIYTEDETEKEFRGHFTLKR